jgi:broad specificity phosphatase PhoE
MRLNAPRPVVTGVGAAVYSVTDRVPRCLLYLVRHGETDWNAAERWQGHTDIPLNATGRAQAHVAAEALSGAGLAGIVASDLARAQETASIIAARLGIGVAYFDADLRERTFGCFEGLTRKECERLHPEAWRAWLAERRAPPGGEAPETLTARVVAGVARVAERVARVDAPALIVTHGGSMRAILTAATGEVPGPIRNGAIWRVEWDQGLVGAEPFPEER